MNKKGFTLVELLAVIVILALLMVVATRTIGSIMGDSKKQAAKTEAQKVVSKAYEDLQTYYLNPSLMTKFTYKSDAQGTEVDMSSITSTSVQNPDEVTFVDSTYTMIVSFIKTDNGYSIKNVCVSDGSDAYLGDIDGNNSVGAFTKDKKTCTSSTTSS